MAGVSTQILRLPFRAEDAILRRFGPLTASGPDEFSIRPLDSCTVELLCQERSLNREDGLLVPATVRYEVQRRAHGETLSISTSHLRLTCECRTRPATQQGYQASPSLTRRATVHGDSALPLTGVFGELALLAELLQVASTVWPKPALRDVLAPRDVRLLLRSSDPRVQKAGKAMLTILGFSSIEQSVVAVIEVVSAMDRRSRKSLQVSRMDIRKRAQLATAEFSLTRTLLLMEPNGIPMYFASELHTRGSVKELGPRGGSIAYAKSSLTEVVRA